MLAKGIGALRSAILYVKERELKKTSARDNGNLATGLNTSDVDIID